VMPIPRVRPELLPLHACVVMMLKAISEVLSPTYFSSLELAFC